MEPSPPPHASRRWSYIHGKRLHLTTRWLPLSSSSSSSARCGALPQTLNPGHGCVPGYWSQTEGKSRIAYSASAARPVTEFDRPEKSRSGARPITESDCGWGCRACGPLRSGNSYGLLVHERTVQIIKRVHRAPGIHFCSLFWAPPSVSNVPRLQPKERPSGAQ